MFKHVGVQKLTTHSIPGILWVPSWEIGQLINCHTHGSSAHRKKEKVVLTQFGYLSFLHHYMQGVPLPSKSDQIFQTLNVIGDCFATLQKQWNSFGYLVVPLLHDAWACRSQAGVSISVTYHKLAFQYYPTQTMILLECSVYVAWKILLFPPHCVSYMPNMVQL